MRYPFKIALSLGALLLATTGAHVRAADPPALKYAGRADLQPRRRALRRR